MKDFQTILFDFDGTLGDTEPDIHQAWKNSIAELGLKCDQFDSVFRVGPALPETAQMLFPEASAELKAKIMNTYKSFYDEMDEYSALPYPGIIEVFQTLSEKYRVYVVTNKRIKPLFKLMKKFDLLDSCAGLFTPDIVSPEYLLTKPELVGMAIRVSGSSLPSQILMVGDTEIDILAGKEHGISTCGVTWGYARPGRLEKSHPDFIINSAGELLDLIKNHA